YEAVMASLHSIPLPPRSATTSTSSTTPCASATPQASTASTVHYMEIDQDDEDDDEDYIPPITSSPFTLSNSQISTICKCSEETVLPTWTPCPPINLGEPSHGKLKANDFLILFTAILPLIVPELWHGPEHSIYDQNLLLNFYNLVAATNI